MKSKKIYTSELLALMILFLFVSPFLAEAYRYVWVEGRKLMTDFNKDNVSEEYIIRGVGYSPFPIGRHPSDWGYQDGSNRTNNTLNDTAILRRDFALLREMGANTIRIWKGDNTSQGLRYPVMLTNTTLNESDNYGIKVIAGYWINQTGWSQCENGHKVYYNVPDFSNVDLRKSYKDGFVKYVNDFKNHTAILFWAIGNEDNNFLDPGNVTNIQAFYSMVEEMAEAAWRNETNNGTTQDYHPVAVVNGDLTYIGNVAYNTTDAQMPRVEIWGSNVYRGTTFDTLFSEFTGKSNKPLWISEFGADSWNVNNWLAYSVTCGATGCYRDYYDGFDNNETQAYWVGSQWDDIMLNKDVAIGGTVMEYSDEWWKPNEWIGDSNYYVNYQNHFGHGPCDNDCDGSIDWYPAAPDNVFNEEWWGVVSVAKNQNITQPDVVAPRDVYYTLQNRFQCVASGNYYYAGSDNQKSCDGTSACCIDASQKSRNGECVNSCGGGGGPRPPRPKPTPFPPRPPLQPVTNQGYYLDALTTGSDDKQ